MRVAVLGGGIIGVSTAWWLNQDGHEVVLIDRSTGVAQETTLANGGQISVSHARPWANVYTLLSLIKGCLNDQAPLLFRPQLNWSQWRWIASFLRECLPNRLVPNIRAMVNLSDYSRTILQAMRNDLRIAYDQVERGILNFYQNEKEFEDAQRIASIMREYGVERRIVTTEEIVALEPALMHHRPQIVGGDYTADDESGDAYLFTTALAKHCKQAGVECRYSSTVTQLKSEAGRISYAEIIDRHGVYNRLAADAFVVALGSESPHLLRSLGVPCNIYPIKGYSATFPISEPRLAPIMSLTDSHYKIVISRLGQRLRMAGTAEFFGYSRALNLSRCEILLRRARILFPYALNFEKVSYWSGLRPSTPSGVPLIGRSRIANLYLNAGHGTLGWTMGPGSGRALADLINGQRPQPEFPFLGPF